MEVSSLKHTVSEVRARQVAVSHIGTLEINVSEVKVGEVNSFQMDTLRGGGGVWRGREMD